MAVNPCGICDRRVAKLDKAVFRGKLYHGGCLDNALALHPLSKTEKTIDKFLRRVARGDITEKELRSLVRRKW